MAVSSTIRSRPRKPIDESFAAILDLERVDPVRRGRQRASRRPSPTRSKAEIKVKMGAMSMTFTGTVEVVEQDDAAHRAVLTRQVASEAGGQGYANADVDVRAQRRRRHDPHRTRRSRGKAASMGEGVVVGVLDALIKDFTGKLGGDLRWPMARSRCGRSARARCRSTAARRSRRTPTGPVFRGNGPDDYVCVECGNVLASSMHPVQMTKKVRVRCGRCSTVNVSVIDEPGRRVRAASASERRRCAPVGGRAVAVDGGDPDDAAGGPSPARRGRAARRGTPARAARRRSRSPSPAARARGRRSCAHQLAAQLLVLLEVEPERPRRR